MGADVDKGRSVGDDALDEARRASPEGFLRRRYGRDVQVSRSGRSIRIAHILRADRRADGRWVACDWVGAGIGDNIALVRHLTGCGFSDAVEEMIGHLGRVGGRTAPPPPPPPPEPPRVPRLAGVEAGRAYLRGRSISDGTIHAAEEAGALHYVQGAVLFLGRDHARPDRPVRLAALRYLQPRPNPADGKPMTKRDLAGSDKRFPVLIPGDPGRFCIVEGGINALAARDLALAAGLPAPTVIASGGVGVRTWLHGNPPVLEMLRAAAAVEIWAENEVGPAGAPDPGKQQRTDALRMRLAEDIADSREGELPRLVYPPPWLKDAADWNAAAALGDVPPDEVGWPEPEEWPDPRIKALAS